MLGQRRAVDFDMVAAVLGTTAAADVAAADAPVGKTGDGPYDDDASCRNCCSDRVISCPLASVA